MRYGLIVALMLIASMVAAQKPITKKIPILANQGVSIMIGGAIFTGFVAVSEYTRNGKILGNTPGVMSPSEVGLSFGVTVSIIGIVKIFKEHRPKRYEH